MKFKNINCILLLMGISNKKNGQKQRKISRWLSVLLQKNWYKWSEFAGKQFQNEIDYSREPTARIRWMIWIVKKAGNGPEIDSWNPMHILYSEDFASHLRR